MRLLFFVRRSLTLSQQHCYRRRQGDTPRGGPPSTKLSRGDVANCHLSEQGDQHCQADNTVKEFLDRFIPGRTTVSRKGTGESRGVFVIQPDYKWQFRKKFILTNVQLQLAESKALVQTLHGWQVFAQAICSVKYANHRGGGAFFGNGQLATLSQQLKHQNSLLMEENRSRIPISVVFVSINMLQPKQLSRLQRLFRCDVYDRYTLVLEIFRRHARTAEAKIQVALAEVPYIRNQLASLGRNRSAVMDDRIRLYLQRHEGSLAARLTAVAQQRKQQRQQRKIKQVPSIAIVGYTNAGKTSLVRALTTSSNNLQPDPRLFATLDVTAHAGKLPCGLSVVYLDTIGFLADLPTGLVAAFRATLADVAESDTLVHVRDLSHPDQVNQKKHVVDTLQQLGVPEKLLAEMIDVGNKVDTLPPDFSMEACSKEMPISAKTGLGLDKLSLAIQDAVLASTGRRLVRLAVPMSGSQQLAWLYREGVVVATSVDEADETGSTLFVDVLFTHILEARFRSAFPVED